MGISDDDRDGEYWESFYKKKEVVSVRKELNNDMNILTALLQTGKVRIMQVTRTDQGMVYTLYVYGTLNSREVNYVDGTRRWTVVRGRAKGIGLHKMAAYFGIRY